MKKIDQLLSNYTPANLLLVCVAFWATVLVVRGVIFWSIQRGVVPAIFVRGYHIHHFVTGFLFLILAAILVSRNIWSKYIPLVLDGVGLALVSDEFLFWTRWHFNYWSMINLLAVIVIGCLLVLFYLYRRKYFTIKSFQPSYKLVHPGRFYSWRVTVLVMVSVVILSNWFSYQNVTVAALKKILLGKLFP